MSHSCAGPIHYRFRAGTLGTDRLGTLLAACLLLTACAKSPSSIAPVAVDSEEYSHLNCKELVAKHREISSLLDTVSSRQNDKQVMDALSVLVILVPASALAGDEEAKIAQFKGEKLALERGIEKRGC